MSEPKPFASLSSGLLARKGAAKPAMRPQGYGHMGLSADDLGWNDMGHHADDDGPAEHVPSSISALTPAPGGRHGHARDEEHDEPAVIEQQRAIEEHFSALPEQEEEEPLELGQPVDERQTAAVVAIRRAPKPVAETKAAPVSRASGAKAKAAFTLRLDPERHLKLRLACAVTGRSAQQLVTGALDEMLSSLPEIEALARQVPDTGKRAG